MGPSQSNVRLKSDKWNLWVHSASAICHLWFIPTQPAPFRYDFIELAWHNTPTPYPAPIPLSTSTNKHLHVHTCTSSRGECSFVPINHKRYMYIIIDHQDKAQFFTFWLNCVSSQRRWVVIQLTTTLNLPDHWQTRNSKIIQYPMLHNTHALWFSLEAGSCYGGSTNQDSVYVWSRWWVCFRKSHQKVCNINTLLKKIKGTFWYHDLYLTLSLKEVPGLCQTHCK